MPGGFSLVEEGPVQENVVGETVFPEAIRLSRAPGSRPCNGIVIRRLVRVRIGPRSCEVRTASSMGISRIDGPKWLDRVIKTVGLAAEAPMGARTSTTQSRKRRLGPPNPSSPTFRQGSRHLLLRSPIEADPHYRRVRVITHGAACRAVVEAVPRGRGSTGSPTGW
jgi:hypothetical protein